MAQGNSIFSNPSSPNGNAPANPFASLNPQSASPFASAESSEKEDESREVESPFGFAEEASKPKSHLPERRDAGASSAAGNPFASAAAAPATPSESPFAPSMGFEAPSHEAPVQSVERGLQAPEKSDFQQPAPPAPEAASPFAAGPSGQSHTGSRGGHSTRQLELRAIFGVEGEMTREEILQHAKQLPGIRELSVVGSGEMNALDTLGDVMSRFGYGDSSSWQVTCSGGIVDFVSGENTTLAVLREGRYSAGVWEKLMIVARELGKLG